MSESNPLVERVDALLKRHQQQASAAQATGLADPTPVATPADPTDAVGIAPDPGAAQAAASDDDIPVLTEIVDPQALPAAGGRAQAEELEAAVLEKFLAELDVALQSRLNRTIGAVVEQAMDGLRADLSVHVRRLLREAVADALRQGNLEHPRSS